MRRWRGSVDVCLLFGKKKKRRGVVDFIIPRKRKSKSKCRLKNTRIPSTHAHTRHDRVVIDEIYGFKKKKNRSIYMYISK